MRGPGLGRRGQALLGCRRQPKRPMSAKRLGDKKKSGICARCVMRKQCGDRCDDAKCDRAYKAQLLSNTKLTKFRMGMVGGLKKTLAPKAVLAVLEVRTGVR